VRGAINCIKGYCSYSKKMELPERERSRAKHSSLFCSCVDDEDKGVTALIAGIHQPAAEEGLCSTGQFEVINVVEGIKKSRSAVKIATRRQCYKTFYVRILRNCVISLSVDWHIQPSLKFVGKVSRIP
jgi:hypothetical protein